MKYNTIINKCILDFCHTTDISCYGDDFYLLRWQEAKNELPKITKKLSWHISVFCQSLKLF